MMVAGQDGSAGVSHMLCISLLDIWRRIHFVSNINT